MKPPKIEKHAVLKESAVRARVVNRLMGEMGLKRLKGARAEWRREFRGVLMSMQATGDGTWWLTAAAENENPGFEFSGNLGQCVMQYSTLVLTIQAGLWDSKRKDGG